MKQPPPIPSNRKWNFGLRLCLYGFLGSVLVLVLLPILPLPGGYVGHQAAKLDIARGHYALRSHGMLAPWWRDYAALLRDRYGIKLAGTPGCVVSHFESTFDREYNAVQRAAIVERFGRDVAQECADEAREGWGKKRNLPVAAMLDSAANAAPKKTVESK